MTQSNTRGDVRTPVEDVMKARLVSFLYSLGLVLLVTSMVDLFINRFLFRVGPDALSNISTTESFSMAVLGRVSLTLEQFVLFIFLGCTTLLLFREESSFSRILGGTLLATVVSSALLYAPLAGEQAWAMSVFLIVAGASAVSGFAYRYLRDVHDVSPRLRVTLSVFLGCLVLSFIFPLYYRVSLLAGAVGVGSLPVPLAAYLAGVFAVMATSLAAFAYALQVPSPRFGLSPRNVLMAGVLPTLLVAPVLYELLRSFFVMQIVGMVLTMSTDIAVSHDLYQALVVVFWFLLTGIVVLLLKGHYAGDKHLSQQGVGLVLLLSTTMLFNYPYYLMLGIAGVTLLCYPLTEARDTKEARVLDNPAL